MEINEIITIFAKKGFLLDRESANFFLNLENLSLSEEILNKVYAITKGRVVSRKILNDCWHHLKSLFSEANNKKTIAESFFTTTEQMPIIKPVLVVSNSEQKKYISDVKIISSNIIPYRRIEVKDFVTHFKNRYNFFKDLLKGRKELENLVSINKIGDNRTISIIGIVLSKRTTKNKNIILELEDLTGKISVLISQDKETLIKKAKEVVLDDVIGVRCSGGSEIIYANEIVFGESYLLEKRKSENESYALFLSDIHVGSKLFKEENFLRFLKWLNGEDVDEATRAKLDKIKYIFITGDNVDGVGVYPGQEALLSIKDVKDQYKKLAEYLKMIPSRIKIIMCPGQHDAVRVPEPQPAIDEDFAKEITEMNNLFLVSNPSTVEVDCSEGRKGLTVLMYHGASLHSWIDEIEELRTGQSNLYPAKVIKYLLRHRHLSPMHSFNVYVPSEKEDSLIIKEIPDIMATGDLHRTEIDIYNNTLIICGSCWQSITPFEEKVGNQPDPCKVPMLNLKTREIKILDFT
jgi:DNA polymerase II small subunit